MATDKAPAFYGYWVKQAKWDSMARAALPLAMGAMSEVGYHVPRVGHAVLFWLDSILHA